MTASAVPTVILVCTAGPDLNKRCAVTASPVRLGRDVACNVLSDDPDVSPDHAMFILEQGRVRFRCTGPAFLDGQPAADSHLSPGQQLRVGRSYWQVQAAGGHGLPLAPAAWVEYFNPLISSVAGVDKIEGFSLRAMLSDVFKKRSPDEVEEYFIAGTERTTPALAAVDTAWPRPWAFFKTALLAVLVYVGFALALQHFLNTNLIPGLIMVGSFAIPGSLLIFFYEVNVLRNVSLYQIVRLFLIGGILSLAIALLLYEYVSVGDDVTFPGAVLIGCVEEVAKAACLLLVVHRLKYRWTLNGLLFGATIGAGFAAFESAGYAFNSLFVQAVNEQSNSVQVIEDTHTAIDRTIHTIDTRGALTIMGGHVMWTALVGAALWKVRDNRPFRWEMLTDKRFLRVLGLAVVLHAAWDSPLPAVFYIKYAVIGLVGWMAVLAYIQDGLKQVKAAQAAAAVPAEGIAVAMPLGVATPVTTGGV